MYSDPRLIRKHIVKVCLNDFEAEELEYLTDLLGEQKQVVLRELMEIGLRTQRLETKRKAA